MNDLEIIKSRVLENFFRRIWHRGRMSRLVVISPWVSDFNFQTSSGTISLKSLAMRVSAEGAYFTLVTRRPAPKDTWHSAALDVLTAEVHGRARLQLKFNQELHAKIFLARLDELQACLIGSANLTHRSLSNAELGLLIRNGASTSKVYRDLEIVATDLVNRSERR